jgi:CubicO group peptidase (beta-lactamase class C family)
MFGYHGLTIGILVEELVRRVTGAALQQLYERDVRSERDLDFYLGLPAVQEHRYVPVRPVPGRRQLTDLAAPRDSLSDLMGNLTTSEETLLTSAASPNLRAIRSAGSAAIGGVGSARGLAAVYAAAIGALDSREPLLDAQTVDLMGQEQVSGRDRLRGVESSFGVLFMKPSPHMDFGSYHAIGHDGAGGALGFADPRYRMGFGYIPQPMQPPGGADPKALRLSRVLRACAARRR